MCYNASVSLATFLIGITFSVVLIKYGIPQYKTENTVFGLYTILIACIQLMEYAFWVDLDGTNGINRIATIIGPLLNAGQPLWLLLIKLLVIKPPLKSVPLFVIAINAVYAIHLVTKYVLFLQTEKMVTNTLYKNKHLLWKWIPYFSPWLYIITFVVNALYLTDTLYSVVATVLVLFLLLLSVVLFDYPITGEMWCFFGAFAPLIMYFLSQIIWRKVGVH